MARRIRSQTRDVRRQAMTKLLQSGLLTDADVEALDALLRQGATQGRSSIAHLEAQADHETPETPDSVQRILAGLSERLRLREALAVPAAPTQSYLIDQATEISASPRITLDAQHIGPTPENNWAKFFYAQRVGDAGFGTAGADSVSFGFLWQNPNNRPVLVDVNGFLVLNGVCAVFSEGGFLGDGFSSLTVQADLILHELWNNPPTAPPQQSTQSQTALDISCNSIGFLEPGNNEGESLFRTFLLQFFQLPVPPEGRVMVELACTLSWWMHDGETESDFTRGDQRVLSPGVLLNVTLA